MRYITCVEVWGPQGSVPVDLIHLYDGRVLGITGDCVVLYDNLMDFEDAPTQGRPTIDLTKGESDASIA